MEMEYLHVQKGENIVTFDTDTPEGRKKLAEEFQKQMRCGSAIFLERAGEDGTKTLRVTGYDPNTDELIVRDDEPVIGASSEQPITRVPDSDIEQEPLPSKRWRKKRIPAQGKRTTAVAPVSGGSL